MRRIRRLPAMFAALAVTAGLVLAGGTPAYADPPEGCVGFPSIPEAFLCIDSFTPENVTPGVATGSTTVTVPEFCVFQCFGPTPVTIPLVEVTVRYGEVARITYRGEQHVVAVNPPPDEVPEVQGGPGCALAVSNDWTGQVVQDPNTVTGTVTGGPWYGSSTTSSVWIRCTIQDQPNHGSAWWSIERFSTTPGPVGALADTVSFQVWPSEDLYLCTVIGYSDAQGGGTIVVDDDEDPANGDQCAWMTFVESGGSRLYFGG